MDTQHGKVLMRPRFKLALPGPAAMPMKRLIVLQFLLLIAATAAIALSDGGEASSLGLALIFATAIFPFVSTAPVLVALVALLSTALYLGLQLPNMLEGENRLLEVFAGLFAFPMVSWFTRVTWLRLSLVERHLREKSDLVEEITLGDRVARATKHLSIDCLLDYEIHRARRYDRPVSLLILDVGDLERNVEEEGVDAADEALATVEGILAGLVRDADRITRRAGTQFAVVLPETPLVGARSVATKICQRVARQPRLSQSNVHLGIAQYPEDGATSEELVAEAHAALEFAKTAGLQIVDRSLIS